LRDVLRNQVGADMFVDMKVEWVPGAAPTAYLHDSNKQVVKELLLGDKNMNELLTLLKENGFVPSRKQIEMGSPLSTQTFGGHSYEIYNIQNYYSASSEFAASRSITANDGQKERGYLLTITSQQENDFIANALKVSNIETAWLGAQDLEEEGVWKWVVGSAEDKLESPFWSNVDGTKLEKFANWRSGEPNNSNEEDCAVMMSSDGGWNDAHCDAQTYAVVVEFGSNPLQLPINQQQVEEAHADL